MASLIFLNIQVLPQSNTVSEIGVAGYDRIFRVLNVDREDTLKSKILHLKSYKLPGSMYINFFNIHFSEEGRVYGDLIKFDQPDAIYDTYSGQKIQDIAVGSSSRRETYKFTFKLSSHIAAIECPAGITPSNLKETFRHFMIEVVSRVFPGYTLSIDIISNSSSIEKVFVDAEYFKTLRAEITYSNQTPFERKMLAKDKELKSKGITKRVVEESANEAGGEISEPTEDMKIALSLAKRLGDAFIRYRSSASKKLESFRYSLNPYKKILKISKKETESEFRDRVEEAIDEAAAQANRAI